MPGLHCGYLRLFGGRNCLLGVLGRHCRPRSELIRVPELRPRRVLGCLFDRLLQLRRGFLHRDGWPARLRQLRGRL